eukprot:TRINITY_DN2984_c0_g2_i1.p1 TRINITY_DN2984_c0_g2~~TRINITY_DN2984_c0_g2_i1.p1  ORF type:complete len:569 (-),score=145.11 TRINITY_DN2984_c0_g2_i1:27-1733(-)
MDENFPIQIHFSTSNFVPSKPKTKIYGVQDGESQEEDLKKYLQTGTKKIPIPATSIRSDINLEKLLKPYQLPNTYIRSMYNYSYPNEYDLDENDLEFIKDCKSKGIDMTQKKLQMYLTALEKEWFKKYRNSLVYSSKKKKNKKKTHPSELPPQPDVDWNYLYITKHDASFVLGLPLKDSNIYYNYFLSKRQNLKRPLIPQLAYEEIADHLRKFYEPTTDAIKTHPPKTTPIKATSASLLHCLEKQFLTVFNMTQKVCKREQLKHDIFAKKVELMDQRIEEQIKKNKKKIKKVNSTSKSYKFSTPDSLTLYVQNNTDLGPVETNNFAVNLDYSHYKKICLLKSWINDEIKLEPVEMLEKLDISLTKFIVEKFQSFSIYNSIDTPEGESFETLQMFTNNFLEELLLIIDSFEEIILSSNTLKDSLKSLNISDQNIQNFSDLMNVSFDVSTLPLELLPRFGFDNKVIIDVCSQFSKFKIVCLFRILYQDVLLSGNGSSSNTNNKSLLFPLQIPNGLDEENAVLPPPTPFSCSSPTNMTSSWLSTPLTKSHLRTGSIFDEEISTPLKAAPAF